MKKVKKSNNSWDVLGMFSGAWSRILSFRSRIALVSLSLFALLLMGGFECEAWAATVTFDGTGNWSTTEKYAPDSFKIAASHVTFSLTKDMKQYNKYEGVFSRKFKSHEYFFLDKNKSSVLRWWPEEGYTIRVSAIYFKAKKGKGYVYTSRMAQGDRQTFDQQASNWVETTFAVNGTNSSLFGTTPVALGNTEYFNIDATTAEVDIEKITLTYTIAPKTYTITLDGEGGTGHSANVTLTFDSNSHTAISNPSKDGCTFQGWYSGDNGTGSLIIDANGNLQANTVYTGAGGVWKKDSTGISLHAKWSGVPYSVRFNGTGSTAGSMSNQAFEYGTAQNLKANGFSKTCTVTYNANGGSCGITSTIANYGFAGWATSADGEVVYANGAEVENLTSTSGAVIDLYAKWAAIADAIVLPTPTKDGFVFLGWYNSSNVLVGDVGGPYVPSGNETLEARWIQALTSTVNKSTLLDKFDDGAKSISWSTEHVTFTLAGDGLKKETWLGTTYFYLYANNDKAWQYNLTWTIDSKDAAGNSAYTINVKKVTFDIERASGLNTYMTIEGRRSGNIYSSGNIPSGGISSGTLNKGENETVTTLVETGDIFYSNIVLNNVTVIYTLEPIIKVAPEQSVEVTICDEGKQLLDLNTCAFPADQSGHIALNYSLIGDNAAHAHKTADNKFYADVVGTYRVRASVDAVADCHSGNTVEFTINVTPATLSLSATADDITYTQALSAVTPTGTAIAGGCPVEGTWAWKYPSTVPPVGDNQSFPVVFTPSTNADYYTNFETTATINVLRRTFIFDGSGISIKEHWINDDNWENNETPTAEDNAIIRHNAEITEEVSVYSVTIDDGYSLTIAPTGGLTVGAGGISGATKDNFFIRADKDAMSARKGQTGYLRVSPEFTGAMPTATVELFTVGYYDMSAENHNELGKWQFIGYPVEDDAVAKAVFSKSWLYNWNATSQEWENNRKTYVLQPFEGYATSQYRDENGLLVTFTGELVAPATKELALTYNAGDEFTHNVRANSFVAPIDITKFEDEDFVNAERTVYIFNTGSQHDVEALASLKGGSVDAPGQYIAIPVGTARAMRAAFSTPTVIAPMQGFCVHATSAGASVTLDYDKIIWRGDYAENSNSPLRVGARNKANEDVQSLRVSVYSENGADNLYLLESEQYDNAYENGYDARKKNEGELNVFAVEGDDLLSVDATNSILGTRVGVRTGVETAYTFAFSHLNSEKELALLDNETNEKIDINEGTEYTFFAEPNSVIAGRFQIVERADAPAIATDVKNVENEVKAHKFIKDNQLYILKNGVLYTATGAVVR